MSKYSQLVDWLREQITSGRLASGSRLDPEVKLAEIFSLSRYSVRQALEQLQSDGLVKSIRGSGTYVTENTRLAKPETKVIGVIITFIDDYIFPAILSGLNARLAEDGYTLNLGITYNKIENEGKIIRSMLASGCDGLIIEPVKSALPNINRDLFDEIIRIKMPCVLINSYYPGISLPYIAPDDKASGKMATQTLLQNGHENICGIFKADDIQGHLRYHGFAEALIEKGLPIIDNRIIWYFAEDLDFLLGGENDKYILGRISGCTAMVCHDDRISVKIIKLLERNNMKVPDDFSIIGFDDSNLASLYDIPLTSMAHPKEQVGNAAADHVLKLIKSYDFDATMLFEPVLVQRESMKSMR